jgi:hypothetical protein
MSGFTHEKPVRGAKDEWLTPKWITDTLGPFDLDPCAPCNPPWQIAKQKFCVCADGLTKPWASEAFIWCNPPYGKQTFVWLDKLAQHPGGGIGLIFARTDTKGFHRCVFEKATSVLFLQGRLKFHHVDGSFSQTATAPSCLIAYGEEAHCRLCLLSPKGRLLRLKTS